MHSRSAFSAVLPAAALVLVSGLGAGPAVAASATWTVTPGGPFETPGASHFSYLTDATTGTVFSCDGPYAGGTFSSGSGLTNPIGTIGLSSLVCGGPGGVQFGVTFSNAHMGIRAVSYDAGTDIVHGSITHLYGAISPDPPISACIAAVDGTSPTAHDGTIRFRYYNNAGQLQTLRGGGNLHAYNVTGCGGLINSGDVLTYGGHANIVAQSHFAVNAITSP